MLISRQDKAKWLRDRLIEFDSLPSPKLLIVDELVALSKNLGNYPDSKEAYTTLTDYAVSIVSSGQSEGRFVWLITQSPNLNTLKIDGGDATIFPGVLLYRDGIDNKAWLKSTARCTLGSAITIDSDEISRVADDSPRRAIAFDTRVKKWQAVPNLINHSGFNRDEYLKTLNSESKGTNWGSEIAILNQRAKTISMIAPLFQEQLAAAEQRGERRGIEPGLEPGLEPGIQQGQRLILENVLRVRFGELDPRIPIFVESFSGLSPEEFILFLLQLSQAKNDAEGCRNLPRLFVENLLKFRWGEVAEESDREGPIQAILALSIEELAEVLEQLPLLSMEDVLARLKGSF